MQTKSIITTLTKQQLLSALQKGQLLHSNPNPRSRFLGERIIKAVTAELADRYADPETWGTL